jgi:segregation and condensation protein B
VDRLTRLLEAALFAASRPVTLDELRRLDPEATSDEVLAALTALRLRYDEGGHGVELAELAEGFQILTRPELADTLALAELVDRPRRLSTAAMETLSIIAYRQPVGRAEIEEIRGVSAGGVLRSLQERGLIEVVGRSEAMGRPLLYGTTPLLLEVLGLRDLGELPRTEEFSVALHPHKPEPADSAEAAASVPAES